ncbi:MAG: 2Fe-2S iron-sulfur cluster-binding protein [Gammaproteobacteria bacterium]
MPKVIYRQPDGSENAVDVPEGWSLMEAAIQNDVSGIVAECGGGCACATCHVYVDDADLVRLPPVSAMEGDMLECTAAERRTGSRLSCQIKMTAALDGLTVEIPDSQT